ncbi:hypothetical protein WN944_029559 [Citrus x changshan-huyou]|uniref:Uncharacterized protein n=1 Tax=Citrus x changshan-huyou TaxID=2935761 RepID=A0AAP0LM01_9ROSI
MLLSNFIGKTEGECKIPTSRVKFDKKNRKENGNMIIIFRSIRAPISRSRKLRIFPTLNLTKEFRGDNGINKSPAS